MLHQRHHQVISARELSRNVASVLDRIEMERQTILVTRAGRPMATLAPLSSRPMDGGTPAVVVLSPLGEKIILTLEERPPQFAASFEDLGEPRDVMRDLSHLELEGLLERDLGTYSLNERGRLVSAVLRARSS